MSNNKSSQNQRIIFPANTFLIVGELLKKYGLKEESEEVFEKIHKGETPLGTILAKTIRETAEKKLGTEELSNLLQKRLNLSSDKAQQLAQDIKREIIGLAEKLEKPVEKPEKKKPPISKVEVKEKKTPPKKDIYREPIE